jgi:hypothetical protein
MMSSESPIAPQRASKRLGRRVHIGSLVLPLVASISLLMMGCGSSDNGVAAKPPGQILAATKAAAQSASSVHVVGHSKVIEGGSFKVDATLARDKGQARVSFLGLSFDAIRVGDTVYLKGNRYFNSGLERTMGVRVPSGVWLKGTTDSLRQASLSTNIEDELPFILGGSGAVTKGATVKLGGQPAIALKLVRKLYKGTLYVATTGQPYPLKLLKTGEETGDTTFTRWNDPVTVTPPPHAVEIAKLQPRKKGR